MRKICILFAAVAALAWPTTDARIQRSSTEVRAFQRANPWLCVIREIRHMFEAAVASKWFACLIVSTLLPR